MNEKFLSATKHWGIGVGALLAGAGLFLAAPENMNTWQRVETTHQIFGQAYTESTHIRLREAIPPGYKVKAIAYGKHETKALGSGILFLGSVMAWVFAQALVPEYERIEKINDRARKSEWKIQETNAELNDLYIEQSTEVGRWSIEIEAQKRISSMLHPPTPYLEDESDEEDEQKALESNKFSETYSGFLGWLQSKEIKQATIRDLAQKSFNGKKIPSEQIRKWVDELLVDELAEWLDDEKKEFRLLNQ